MMELLLPLDEGLIPVSLRLHVPLHMSKEYSPVPLAYASEM